MGISSGYADHSPRAGCGEAHRFPDDIEMLYHCLDEHEKLTGRSYVGVHFTWGEVQRSFCIDDDYANECEGYFRNGNSAFLGNREVIIEVDESSSDETVAGAHP